MSHPGVKMRQMESVRLQINEHMMSVGEEMVCVLEKHTSDVCFVKLNIRVFVLDRLGAAAEFMCNLFQREMETLLHNTKLHTADHHRERSIISREMASEEQREMDQGQGLIDARLLPVLKLERIDRNCPVYSEVSDEQWERNSGLLQEEPGPVQNKKEYQRPEEDDGSTLTSRSTTVESEDEDENRETEPVASTSTEHMKTQADVQDRGTSQPTSDDQLLSSRCYESDTEDRDEDWEETREDQSSALNTLKSQKKKLKRQRLSLSNKPSEDPKSLKQTDSIRSNRGKNLLNCTICGEGCSQRCDLKRHMRTHSKERRFTCEVCGKECSQKGNLKIHMRIHTGEKPFTCTVCRKDFRAMGNLQLHMRIHTKEKPFTCTICGKGFNHKSHLKTHTSIHTGEKPFICEFCGNGYNQNSSLKSHLRVHTGEKPFACEVCGKKFGRSGELKLHMRIHTGEKPFSCLVCGKRFAHESHQKRHTRIHTGEKPFTCTICAKKFSRNGHLQKHLRTHKDNPL